MMNLRIILFRKDASGCYHASGWNVSSFREELMSKSCPASIKDVIKSIILLKGVKQANNGEGLELFDGDEDDEEPGENKSEDEEDESIFDTDLLEDIPTELEVQPPE